MVVLYNDKKFITINNDKWMMKVLFRRLSGFVNIDGVSHLKIGDAAAKDLAHFNFFKKDLAHQNRTTCMLRC